MVNTLLIIGFVWPEPKSSAAGSRMLQLIDQFKKLDYEITFATTANVSDNTFDLNAIGVSTKTIILNDDSFDAFVKALNPNSVLFDRFMTEEQFGWRIAEHCPNALRILDTEDFHGLRKAREVVLKQNRTLTTEDLQSDITKREIASIYRSDLTLMISEVELELLQSEFEVDKKLLYYLPFLLEPISEVQIFELPKFENRQHFITVGNFLHSPNYDAVLYLKTTIWPLVHKVLPEAQLHVYGAYVQQKAKQLHNPKEGFYINGFTEDVNDVMQNAKVCLAPLRFGAGLKGKLVDAMQNGTPCAMSTIAAEGMFGDLSSNGFIEDDPEIFAEKAIELYTSNLLWKEKQNHGFNIINTRFNKFDFENSFANKLQSLIINLKKHRQENFIGQLLMHHFSQSTKYMSKWITEKNKV